jgi:ABC-type Fe3+-citrate transport system substrate-binding protein
VRLSLANIKAVKYACLNFHYQKKVPALVNIAHNIYNDSDEWCGCIVYNRAIGKHIASSMSYTLELIRVALNGKQEFTSKAISMSINKLKKEHPEIHLLISYADSEQGHYGTIYQATNWYYINSYKTDDKYIDDNGVVYHRRTISKSGFVKHFGQYVKCRKFSDLQRIPQGKKHLYYYPLTKEMKQICEQIKKPYPKKTTS